MIIYEIQKGDTLYEIASMYDTTVERISEANNINPNDTLVVGQAISIPQDNINYQVSRGDSLYRISRRFGVPIESILAANPSITNPSLIYPGQMLTIPLGIKPYNVVVNGYMLPSIMETTLNRTLPYLTYLSIFSYEVLPNGSLRMVDDEDYIREAKNRGVEPLLTITNIDGSEFSSELASVILNNEQISNNLITNILDTMIQKGYYGVNVDFEYLYPSDKDAYTIFLEKLTLVMRQNGYIVAVAVAPKTSDSQMGLLYEAHDYKAIGDIVDIVIIMTYEWGYLYGEPQAISPINKIEEVVNYAITKINPQKILLGVSNYAYDWTLPYVSGEPAAYLSNQQALSLAREKGSTIMFDKLAQSPYFYYYTPTNRHVVWFEDVRSLSAKLGIVEKYNLLGISIWNINFLFNTYGLLEKKF
ncbi:MAG: LysM peptidoglycan-binding domain-containing protein [Clostridia bacterium]|nr:LysM peptidoglycan-binding domain-containing protein [Clostridia bacterium]